MAARKAVIWCRVAAAFPCTFRLFFGVGHSVGRSFGRSNTLQIIPLTILLIRQKAAFCGENTPLITI